MTVYALERANNDLAIFLLVICGAILFTFPRPYRLFSYGLFVAAGLLKYYPLALLVLAAREGRRDRLVIAAAAILALVLFAVAFYPELSMAAASIPTAASYFTDAFSPQPAVRVCGSAGRGSVSNTDRGRRCWGRCRDWQLRGRFAPFGCSGARNSTGPRARRTFLL